LQAYLVVYEKERAFILIKTGVLGRRHGCFLAVERVGELVTVDETFLPALSIL
jgi:hypothetical protein